MRVINIYQTRHANTTESCVSTLRCEELWIKLVTLEDPVRDKKIQHVTAFGEGVYELGYREVLSEKTIAYRKRFDWFEWHIEVKNVPNYKYVYMHIGNVALDTDGCVLLGEIVGKKDIIHHSEKAFEFFYKKLKPLLLDDDVKIYLHVENCF